MCQQTACCFEILISLTKVVQPEYFHLKSEVSARKYQCYLRVLGRSSALHLPPFRKTGTFWHLDCRLPPVTSLLNDECLTLANLKGHVTIPNNFVTKSETKQGSVSDRRAQIQSLRANVQPSFLSYRLKMLPSRNVGSQEEAMSTCQDRKGNIFCLVGQKARLSCGPQGPDSRTPCLGAAFERWMTQIRRFWRLTLKFARCPWWKHLVLRSEMILFSSEVNVFVIFRERRPQSSRIFSPTRDQGEWGPRWSAWWP